MKKIHYHLGTKWSNSKILQLKKKLMRHTKIGKTTILMLHGGKNEDLKEEEY